MKGSFKNKLVWLMLIAFLMLPVAGMAQDAFSGAPSGKQMAQNVTDTANSFSVMIQAIIALVGFIITCVGVYGFYRVTKEKGQGQASIPLSLAGCVVGMLMIMLPLTIGTLGKSLFGDQMQRPSRIEITPN